MGKFGDWESDFTNFVMFFISSSSRMFCSSGVGDWASFMASASGSGSVEKSCSGRGGSGGGGVKKSSMNSEGSLEAINERT